MATIEIKQVLTQCKEDLRLSATSEYDLFLKKRIDRAAHRLGVLENQVIECANIEIECNKGELPDNYIDWYCLTTNACTGGCSCSAGVLNVNTGTANADVNTLATGGVCGCPQYFVASQKVLTDFCGMGISQSQVGYYANYFEIQDGFIYFPSNSITTTVKLYYIGKNLDEWGRMKIDEESEDALSAYACYKFMRAYPERDTGRRMMDFQQEWVNQKNSLKGDSQRKYFRQHKAIIASIYNALMVDKQQYAGR